MTKQYFGFLPLLDQLNAKWKKCKTTPTRVSS
jgi:hypothetical protein